MTNAPDAEPEECFVQVMDLCDKHFAELCDLVGINAPDMQNAEPVGLIEALEDAREELGGLLYDGTKLSKHVRHVLGYLNWLATLALVQYRIEVEATGDGETRH